MPNTSSKTPDPTEGDQPQLSLQEQIDQLLTQIETEEPGTINKAHLPADFMKQQQGQGKQPEAQAKPAAFTPAPEPTEDMANEMANFAQAINEEPAAATEAPAEQAEAPAQPAPKPEAPKPEAPKPTDAQAEMLAALNSALQGMGGGAKPEAPAAEPPENEQATQDEINALLNAETQQPPAPAPQPAAMPEAAAQPDAEPAISTEDQIAMEIEGLLKANEEPTGDEPTIDDLDKMLASEIDGDDELAGDFQSVDDITKGIETGPIEEPALQTEHAATAGDVAAELDSQPENKAKPAAEFDDEDPLAALDEIAQTAEKNEKVYQEKARKEQLVLELPGWFTKLRQAKDWLLQGCFVLNWPARRFLTTEWRANLGYIALMNLFFGVAVWLYIIIF